MSRGDAQFKLRLPDGLLNQIKADALANNRSVNAEIVRRLLEQQTPLRDWFAGQALAGMNAADRRWDGGNKDMAKAAYSQADALLAEREARS